MDPFDPYVVSLSTQVPETFNHGDFVPNGEVYDALSTLVLGTTHSLPSHWVLSTSIHAPCLNESYAQLINLVYNKLRKRWVLHPILSDIYNHTLHQQNATRVAQ